MKKLLPYAASLLALQALIPSQVLASGPSPSFADVNGHWAESDVRTAIDSGWVNGFPDGSFQPDRTVTRGEFLKLLVKAKGVSATAAIADPRLAALNEHNSDTQHWVATNGYLKAGLAGHFVEPADYGFSFTKAGAIDTWSLSPDQPVSRLEAAIFVTRAMGRQYDAEAFWLNSNKGQIKSVPKPSVSFNDAAAIPLWALGWVKTASEAGAIKGFPDGAFHGDAQLSRAQAVTLLRRLNTTPASTGGVISTLGQGYPETEYEVGNMANRDLTAFRSLTVAPLKGYSGADITSAFHHLPKADKEAALKERTLAFWAELQQRNLSPLVLKKAVVQLKIGDYFLASGEYDGSAFSYTEGYWDPSAVKPDPQLEGQLLNSIINDPQDREQEQTEKRRAEAAKNVDALQHMTMSMGYQFPFQYMGDLLSLSDADLQAWGRPRAQEYWTKANAIVEKLGGHLEGVKLTLRPQEPFGPQYLGLQISPTLRANPPIELTYDGANIAVNRVHSIHDWASTLKPDYFWMGGDGATQDWHQPVEEAARSYMETFALTLGGEAPARDLPLERLSISVQASAAKVRYQPYTETVGGTVRNQLALVIANPFASQNLFVRRLLQDGKDLVVVASGTGTTQTSHAAAIAAPDASVTTCIVVDEQGHELYRAPMPPRP